MAASKQALIRFRRWCHERQFRQASIQGREAAGQVIYDHILSGLPFMFSRFGACEINVVNCCRQRRRSRFSRFANQVLTGVPPHYTEKVRFAAHNNAGIFPETDEGLDQFAQITMDSCRRIDMLGVWRFLRLEETLQKERCPSAMLVDPQAAEPCLHDEPWSAALEGKRVLVIHPFAKSIRAQFRKREQLYPDTQILPEFELRTIQAVQSAAGNPVEFSSWAEALKSMTDQIDDTPFDVALIGAGAYGLPLAAHVKDLGKQAVHMGGATQILFGIKGGRWDDNPEINRFYNEYWTRPLPEETPAQSGRVEEGCYW